MPRSPRSRKTRGKPTGGRHRQDRSLSRAVNTPLPPSPSDCPLPDSPPPSEMNAKVIENAVAKCLNDDSFIEKLVARLSDRVRDAVTDTLSRSLEQAQARIDELSGEVSKLRAELQRVEENAQDKLDELEQYNRRNNLRIFGIPESRGEVTDDVVIKLLQEKIGVDLPLDRLERSHRVGVLHPSPHSDQPPRPRPIIVRFCSYRDRREVYNKKKTLKGTGVTIREDLTQRRAEVLRRAIELHGPRKAWTLDGRVLWEDASGRRHFATSLRGIK